MNPAKPNFRAKSSSTTATQGCISTVRWVARSSRGTKTALAKSSSARSRRFDSSTPAAGSWGGYPSFAVPSWSFGAIAMPAFSASFSGTATTTACSFELGVRPTATVGSFGEPGESRQLSLDWAKIGRALVWRRFPPTRSRY